MLNLIPELFLKLHNIKVSYFLRPKYQRKSSLKQGSETNYLILDIATCSHLNKQLILKVCNGLYFENSKATHILNW